MRNRYIQISIPTQIMQIILYLIFSFAFIFAPFWHGFQSILLKYICLFSLSIIGIFWAKISAGKISFTFHTSLIIPGVIVSILLFIAHGTGISSDIPWRGDEEYHINRLLDIFGYLGFLKTNRMNYYLHNPLFTILFIDVILVILLYIFKKYHRASFASLKSIASRFQWFLVPIIAMILYPATVFIDQRDIFKLADVYRYPFIQKWLHLLFVWIDPHRIELYRLVPLLSLMIISWIILRWFYMQGMGKLLASVFAFALTTIPLFMFYGSLLYLELPLILCLMISIYDIRFLILAPQEKLIKRPAWYALLLCAFLKETVVVILLVYVVTRFIYQSVYVNRKKILSKLLISEIKIYTVVLGPLFLYFLFRQVFSGFRPYGLEYFTLFQPYAYIEVTKSLYNQFGFVSALFIVALLYLYKTDKKAAILQSMLLVTALLFFMGDVGQLAGYSRWNLYLLPSFYYVICRFIIVQKKYIQVILAILILVSNVIQNPILSDGTRVSNWGIPDKNISEYIYPYEDALKWVGEELKPDELVMSGFYGTPYFGVRFYFQKMNWCPEVLEKEIQKNYFTRDQERGLLSVLLTQLKNDDRKDVIIYQSLNALVLEENSILEEQFRVRKEFRNSLNRIYVLERVQ